MTKKKIKGVYMLYFKNNNRVYIGSSMNIKNRISNHKSSLKGFYHTNSLLQRDYNIYGKDNLCWEILEEFDKVSVEELLTKESEYILKYKSHIYGYNKTCITSNGKCYKNTIFTYEHSDMIKVIKIFLLKHNVKFELIKNSIFRETIFYSRNNILSYNSLQKDSKIINDIFKYLNHDIITRKRSFPQRKFSTTAILCPHYITNLKIRKKYLPIAKSEKINKCLIKLYNNKYKKKINNIYIIYDFYPYKKFLLKNFSKWEYKLFNICRELEEGRFEDEITITVLDKETLETFNKIQEEVLNERN